MKQHEVFPNSKSHNSLSRISCRTRFSLLGVIRYSLSWTACNSNKAAWQPQNYHIPTPCTLLILVNFLYYVKLEIKPCGLACRNHINLLCAILFDCVKLYGLPWPDPDFFVFKIKKDLIFYEIRNWFFLSCVTTQGIYKKLTYW